MSTLDRARYALMTHLSCFRWGIHIRMRVHIEMDTRTFHLGGGPQACPVADRSGSTFLSDESCVMRYME